MKKGTLIKSMAIILALVLVAGVIFYFVSINNKNASSVMEISVNPQVQVVLNNNNRVISVQAKNEDADKLLINANLVGKTAEEAAQIIIDLSVQSGYIQVDTTGTKVEVNISGENIEAIQNSVINSINKYFDENGIIAGAVADLKEDLQTAATNLGVSVEKYQLMLEAEAVGLAGNVEELKNKTEAELLEIIGTGGQKLQGVLNSVYTGAITQIQNIYSQFSDMFDLEETIIDYKNQLNDSELPAIIKDNVRKLLNTAQNSYNQFKTAFDESINNLIEQLKESSAEIKQQIQTEFNNLVEANASAIENYKTYVEAHREEIQAKIDAYRATLTQE